MLHYDAILFDVDGTLIDSAPGILNTLEEVFSSMGVDTTNVNLRRYIGPPLRKSFGEHFSDPALIEKATDYRDSYAVEGQPRGAAYPGAAEMLQRLKNCGPCAVHRYLQAHARSSRPFWKKRALQATLILSAVRPWMRAATTRPTSSATSWPSPSCRAGGC